jgi:rod shape-determining protein MreC
MTNVRKVLSQWLVYPALVVAASGVMLVGKADTIFIERLRVHVADIAAPILDALSRPVATATEAIAGIGRWTALGEENAGLRAERGHLLQWQAVAQRLEAENAELRKLLNLAPEPEATFLTARVVADPGGAFAHSVLVLAGEHDGVEKGQIVVSGEGLVGRVVASSHRASRVLLISDLNSRVPVLAGAANVRAVLAGDNSERPKLIRLDPGAAVTVGDRVVTSGTTDAFPPGLPVGVVAMVDDGNIRVAPFIRRGRLEYVRVVDHRLPALTGDLAGETPAPRSRAGRTAAKP